MMPFFPAIAAELVPAITPPAVIAGLDPTTSPLGVIAGSSQGYVQDHWPGDDGGGERKGRIHWVEPGRDQARIGGA